MGQGRKKLRTVKSFVRREGHMTQAQRVALEHLWSKYGLEPGGDSVHFREVFKREAPIFLEIGFGMGDALFALACAHPENDYLGAEVYRPGIGRLLARLEESSISNVRVYQGDAVEVLRQCIPDASLSGVYVFFPDPWPKRRHHKRRLIQPDFVTLISQKLKHHGIFHLATDWENYARHMMKVISADRDFHNLSGEACFSEERGDRRPTKYERRSKQVGHRVWDLRFQR